MALENVCVNEPEKRPKTIYEAITRVLTHPREIESLCKELQERYPRPLGSYKRILLSEFETNNVDGRTFVYPEISDHGVTVCAKFVASRGNANWVLRKYPNEILARAYELGIGEKVQRVVVRITTPRISIPEWMKSTFT